MLCYFKDLFVLTGKGWGGRVIYTSTNEFGFMSNKAPHHFHYACSFLLRKFHKWEDQGATAVGALDILGL